MMSIFYNNNAETTKEERIQQFKEIMYIASQVDEI